MSGSKHRARAASISVPRLPTHGLVPYTGITPLDPVIDHAGVMSTTVAETAFAARGPAGLGSGRHGRGPLEPGLTEPYAVP
jgi:amidase